MLRNLQLSAILVSLTVLSFAQEAPSGRLPNVPSWLNDARHLFNGKEIRPVPAGADPRSDAVIKGLATVTQYRWTTIDYPGASFSSAADSNGGTTIGKFSFALTTPGIVFMLRNGAYQLVDLSGFSTPTLAAVNESGEIVGSYFDANTRLHGLLDVDGVVTTLDFPGAIDTTAFDINNAGVIVGGYNDASGGHGYSYNAGQFTTLDFPGALFTTAHGVNSNGDIVGSWIDNAGFFRGFLYQNGIYTSLTFPLSPSTQPAGINDAGDIVGTFFEENGFYHGFLYSHKNYSQIDVPGATLTQINHIRNGGRLIGLYYDQSGESHGLIGN